MDINNNQQVNTFTGGMNTDTSDMYIDSKQYRYAENIRIVTDTDNNSGEVRPILGTTWVNLSEDTDGEHILDIQYIRDIAVAIILEGGKWAVYVIDQINQDAATARIKRITQLFEEKIWPDDWDGKTKPISTVLRYEEDNNIKLYIADGIHPIMALRFKRNLAPVDGDFESVFGTSTKGALLPIQTYVSSNSGGNLPAVRLQYAYILYDAYGNRTTLSALSNVISVQNKNDNSQLGYSNTEPINKSVNLTVPEIDTNAGYIKIYRIAYVAMGQQPTVDIIYDGGYFKGDSILDDGSKIESSSYTDLLSMVDSEIKPKLIESKNNYMFAGNVKYTQDEVDEKFKRFDARCYNPALEFKDDVAEEFDQHTPCEICYDLYHEWDESKYEQLREKTISDLKQSSYSNWLSNYNWQRSDWMYGGDDYGASFWANGIGTCLAWCYTLVDGDDNTPSYARNEVYRFGIRLFDENGNASSVKWIADIKMPDYYSQLANQLPPYLYQTDASYLTNPHGGIGKKKISIKFVPINKDVQNSPWDGVSAYEIVQCVRTIDDSWNISQGLYGLTTHVSEDPGVLCTPMFLTSDHFLVCDTAWGISTMDDGDVIWQSGYRGQHSSNLLFASPETTYQIDDVNNIMQLNKNQIKLQSISRLGYFSDTFSIFTDGRVGESKDYFRYHSALHHFMWQYGSISDGYSDIYGQFVYGVDGGKGDWGMLIGLTRVPNDPNNPDLYNSHLTYYCDLQTSVKNLYPEIKERRDETYASTWPIGKLHRYYEWQASGVNYMSPSLVVKYDGVNRNIDHFKSLPADQNKVENFSKDDRLTYGDSAQTFGEYKYFQYTNPFFAWWWEDPNFDPNDKSKWEYQAIDTHSEGQYYRYMDAHNPDESIEKGKAAMIPMSHGGQAMLIKTSEGVPVEEAGGVSNRPRVYICNIIKTITSCYGGYNDTQINLSKYISIGAIQTPNSSVIVNGGDVYIQNFRYNHTTNVASNYFGGITSYKTVYDVPVETRINLNAQSSTMLRSSDRMSQDLPTSIRGYTQDTPAYLYNTAYGIQPNAIIYTAAGRFSEQLGNNYDVRIHYSDPKTNNEVLDSWTNFRALNFMDVDTRHGQLTGLKLFRDKLIFFQERAAGLLSVNERSIVQDTGSTSIILGDGGVLSRYDYFTTLYGMKPDQKAYGVSNDMLYWWDGHSKEIIGYTDGYNIQQLQRIKSVANYVNEHEESDTPSIMYDRKNKEVLLNVVNNQTLVYNEQMQQFQSIYTFAPVFYCEINDAQLMPVNMGGVASFAVYNRLCQDNVPKLFNNIAKPSIKYIVNANSTYNKVFDNQTFGGRFYGGEDSSKNIRFTYRTPLKQMSSATWNDVVNNYEYDYRLAIPRNNDDVYGGRMRGKTMECEITAPDNTTMDFSLQYVTTKFRMSWT